MTYLDTQNARFAQLLNQLNDIADRQFAEAARVSEFVCRQNMPDPMAKLRDRQASENRRAADHENG